MEYFAHSPKGDIPAQTYRDHVENVHRLANRFAQEAERFATQSKGLLTENTDPGASLHDFGKLLEENQEVLRGDKKRARLPIHHEDAGVAYLLNKEANYAAISVFAHHRGLPDFQKEFNREGNAFRDAQPEVIERTNKELDRIAEIHHQIYDTTITYPTESYKGDQNLFIRLLLSCLTDADHTNTAENYGQYPTLDEMPELRAEERVKQLDAYVKSLETSDPRSHLRSQMYENCRNSVQASQFVSCDSPVGSGKTTAVMAHLLKQASSRGLRRIFVVLPFTTIITQSVDVYRRALTLPGEDPEKVVAELHSRADFEDKETRYLTSLWRSPIIVTTAVAFYETLASNYPSTLRRLHELPGSAFFIDESHASLPLTLLPLAWKWMVKLAEEWSCYWVLGSGSLVEFWKLNRLTEYHPIIPELVPSQLRNQLMQYEKDRITFQRNDQPLSLDEFIDWTQSFPGPRLVIVNTIKCAAVVADELCSRYGRDHIEHLSTALTAADRAITVRRIKARVEDEKDTDWTLVATSCVEAGVDFSFRTGFRQTASLLSLIQASGRVNRHGRYPNAEIWDFTFQDNDSFPNHKGFELSAQILKKYFVNGKEISPALSTKAIEDQITENDSVLRTVHYFLDKEKEMAFETVAKEFNVIEDRTVVAIFDPELIRNVQFGKGNWRLIQNHSFNIRKGKESDMNLKMIAPDIYQWMLDYDDFLGYMKGVLWKEKTKTSFLDF